jgi:hypothetical protein
MIDGYLVDQCELIATTRNDFGDEVEGVTQVLPCRWRDITLVRRGSHQDTSDASSLVHLKADAPVVRGSILKYNGEYYQVDEITYARRLGETTVQFIKCGVTITNLGVS